MGRLRKEDDEWKKEPLQHQDEDEWHMDQFRDHSNEVEKLKKRISELEREMEIIRGRNEKLSSALRNAEVTIINLKEEVSKLTSPPLTYATLIRVNPDGNADIEIDGRCMRVKIDPAVLVDEMKPGRKVLVNQYMNIVEVCGSEESGEVVQVKEVLGDRAIVIGRGFEEKVVRFSDELLSEKISTGDVLLSGMRSSFVYQKLPKSEVEEVVLEEVPDVEYSMIGGLNEQIEIIRDAVELPYLYPDEFREFKISPPKGILLYGPPGCGKTMLAKAVAKSLAERVRERTGRDVNGYFLNVKGPELLNKYVGETERKIREVFTKAKEKAREDIPVIIFFDEMDALFRLRGSGISSDIETTIVAQFLSELDGVESIKNVIVIGASNRQDLIDPAVLRPGRMDLKIKVGRPDRDASLDILSKYLTADLPISAEILEFLDHDRERAAEFMRKKIVEWIFDESKDTEFAEIAYADGTKETIYFRHLISGALLSGIVNRAKRIAIKRFLNGGEKGIKLEDLRNAITAEFIENTDIPQIESISHWEGLIEGKGRVLGVRILRMQKREGKPRIEEIKAGQYL